MPQSRIDVGVYDDALEAARAVDTYAITVCGFPHAVAHGYLNFPHINSKEAARLADKTPPKGAMSGAEEEEDSSVGHKRSAADR